MSLLRERNVELTSAKLLLIARFKKESLGENSIMVINNWKKWNFLAELKVELTRADILFESSGDGTK